MAEVFELRPHFEWRGLGFISHSGLKLHRGLRRARCRGPLQRPRHPGRRPQGVPVRRGAQGRDQALGVQGVRHRVHAGTADRHLHGVLRGRLRGVLQLRALCAGAGSGLMADRAAVSEREQTILGIIETARGKRAKFRDARITMAHGAGGKATQGLIEGLLAPAFRLGRRSTSWPTPRRSAVDGAELALTTDSYVVKPLRFPGRLDRGAGGQRHRQRPRGLRAPGPVALSLSLILEEGLAADELRAEVEAIARAARRGRRRGSSPATPRWWSAATPTACTSARAASAATTRGRSCRRRPCAPATGSCSRGASASTARRSCWRATSSSSTPRSSPTPARCGPSSTRCSRRPGPGCTACATPRAAAWPRCSTSWRAPRRWR